MKHPELEKEKDDNYPSIRQVLSDTYGKDIQGIGEASLRAEEGGNQGYGFHVTLPDSESPDFFFKIEKNQQNRTSQEQSQVDNARQLMEELHNNSRNNESRKDDKNAPDSAKFIRDNKGSLINHLQGDNMPADIQGHEMSLQTNLGAEPLPVRQEIAEQRNRDYEGKETNPDKNYERFNRMAIDVNPSSYPDYTIAETARTLGKLHNAGESKVERESSVNSEFNQTVGDGSVFQEKREQLEKSLNGKEPTKEQEEVLGLFDRMIQQTEEGKLEQFQEVVQDFDKLPQTGSVHHDAHPLNFLQKKNKNALPIPGEEEVVPIDMEDLSSGARVEDLALLVGQTRIDHNALKPHQNINPMGDKVDEKTTKTIINAYEETASQPLTEEEAKHMFNYKEGSRSRDKLTDIAKITPEQFQAGNFEGIDKDFSLDKPLDTFEKSKQNDIPALVKQAREEKTQQQEQGKQILDGLDLDIKPEQLERIGQSKTERGKSASSAISRGDITSDDVYAQAAELGKSLKQSGMKRDRASSEDNTPSPENTPSTKKSRGDQQGKSF